MMTHKNVLSQYIALLTLQNYDIRLQPMIDISTNLLGWSVYGSKMTRQPTI